jgi:hypothetical protein
VISARFASSLWRNGTALRLKLKRFFLDATAVPQILQRTTVDQ